MKSEKREASLRLNAWDWTLLVIALLSLLLAVGYLLVRRERERSETRILVVMRVSGIEREELADGEFPIGASVRSENGSSVLGLVESVETKAHVRPVLRDGSIAFEEDAMRADLEITVSMSGHVLEGEGIRVQDLRIAAGGTGSFRVGARFLSGVEILSVEVTE